MSNTTSASEQIELLQQQIERLKERSIIELKAKLAEAKGVMIGFERELERLTGVAEAQPKAPTKRKKRTAISIGDVVQSIKGGATNYKAVAGDLGCSPITVTKKIETEGKGAGISITGRKAALRLAVV